jgi:serine/threonine protein kinase
LYYSAVAASAGGFIHFFGITKLPGALFEDPSTADSDNAILCLVLERATKGNLKEFLEQYSKKDDWAFILETLKAVGGGLHSLHKRGIAHRYHLHYRELILVEISILGIF